MALSKDGTRDRGMVEQPVANAIAAMMRILFICRSGTTSELWVGEPASGEPYPQAHVRRSFWFIVAIHEPIQNSVSVDSDTKYIGLQLHYFRPFASSCLGPRDQ